MRHHDAHHDKRARLSCQGESSKSSTGCALLHVCTDADVSQHCVLQFSSWALGSRIVRCGANYHKCTLVYDHEWKMRGWLNEYQFWHAVTILVWAVLFKTADEGKVCRPRQVHLVSLYSRGGHLSCGAKRELRDYRTVSLGKILGAAPGGHLRGSNAIVSLGLGLSSSLYDAQLSILKSIWHEDLRAMWESCKTNGKHVLHIHRQQHDLKSFQSPSTESLSIIQSMDYSDKGSPAAKVSEQYTNCLWNQCSSLWHTILVSIGCIPGA